MKTRTIQSTRLYHNIAGGDTIFNSQAAMLVFIVGVAFKLSALPGVLNEEFGSSAFWAFLLYVTIDTILAVMIFSFCKRNGDALLVATNSTLYRIICLFIAIWLTFKGVFHFAYASSYLTHELFEGLEPSLIYILFLLPVVYLGAKGIRTIARTSEVFFGLIFIFLAVNIIFIETKMDFARVLPVLSKEPSTLAATFPRYGIWLGDLTPFLFVRVKNKKLPYITIGVAGTFLILNLVALLGCAVYGDALKSVTDLFIRISGFNQLSKDVGRMEWTNLFGMIASSIISLAFTYFGATSACKRAFKTSLPFKIMFPAVILACTLIIPSAQSVAKFAMGQVGYIAFALAIVLPASVLALSSLKRKTLPHLSALLNEEYIVKVKAPVPNSRPATLFNASAK